MKKILIFILTFCITLTPNIFAKADASAVNDAVTQEIHSFIKNSNKDVYIKSKKELRSPDNEVSAWEYRFEPKGYAIIESDLLISEYSFESNSTLPINKIVYYGGPLNYYIKDTSSPETFIKINSDTKISKSILVDKINIAKANIKSNKEQIVQYNNEVQPRAIISKYIPGTLRTYNYNPNGICGSTAAAIFLMYYRDHVDSFVVPSWHDTSDGVSLIKLLEPNIDGDEPGSVTSDMVYGLNWYTRWRGISSSYNATSSIATTFDTYKAKIDNNRPVVVDLNNNPTYGEHWVVGYGYTIYEGMYQNNYIVCNNGWGQNDISIHMHYVGDVVYLNK